jgi:hypothetical protein
MSVRFSIFTGEVANVVIHIYIRFGLIKLINKVILKYKFKFNKIYALFCNNHIKINWIK